MDEIKKLIEEEKELKIQLKNIRAGLKEKLEASSIYAACPIFLFCEGGCPFSV